MSIDEYGGGNGCRICGAKGHNARTCKLRDGQFTAEDVIESSERAGGRAKRDSRVGVPPTGFLSPGRARAASNCAPDQPPPSRASSREEDKEAAKRKTEEERRLARMEREKRIAERKEAAIAAKNELAAREEQLKVQEAKKLAEKKEKDLEERVQRKGV